MISGTSSPQNREPEHSCPRASTAARGIGAGFRSCKIIVDRNQPGTERGEQKSCECPRGFACSDTEILIRRSWVVIYGRTSKPAVDVTPQVTVRATPIPLTTMTAAEATRILKERSACIHLLRRPAPAHEYSGERLIFRNGSGRLLCRHTPQCRLLSLLRLEAELTGGSFPSLPGRCDISTGAQRLKGRIVPPTRRKRLAVARVQPHCPAKRLAVLYARRCQQLRGRDVNVARPRR